MQTQPVPGLTNLQNDNKAVISAVFTRLVEAWNTSNGPAYSQCFTEEATYITFDGSSLKGRSQIAEAHQTLFETFLKGSKLEQVEIKDVILLSPDIALAWTTGLVRLRWQRKALESRRSIQTYMLVKQAEQWYIQAFQNTRIQKPNFLLKLIMRLTSR